MLTMENLRKAVKTIMSSKANLEFLPEYFDEVQDMSDEEMLSWSVDRICSEKLLDELNRRMCFLPVASMSILKYDTSESASDYEALAGHDVTVMPKVWPKRMAFVGFNAVLHCHGNNDFFAQTDNCCYIDEDGEVVCIRQYYNAFELDMFEEQECPGVNYSELIDKDSEDACFLLNDVDYLLPDSFEGFWDI